MRFTSKLFVAATFLVFLGCVPARIESNIRAGYTKKLEKVFVVFLSKDNDTIKFYEELAPQLFIALRNQNIQSEFHVYKPLGLDEKNIINNKLEAFTPSHILQVSLTSKETTRYNNAFGPMHGAPSGASFELTLSEPGSEDIVWKATLDTKGSSFGAGFYSSGTVGNAEATVRKIIESLQMDGLIKEPISLPGKA